MEHYYMLGWKVEYLMPFNFQLLCCRPREEEEVQKKSFKASGTNMATAPIIHRCPSHPSCVTLTRHSHRHFQWGLRCKWQTVTKQTKRVRRRAVYKQNRRNTASVFPYHGTSVPFFNYNASVDLQLISLALEVNISKEGNRSGWAGTLFYRMRAFKASGEIALS